jgi:hypothetical protein
MAFSVHMSDRRSARHCWPRGLKIGGELATIMTADRPFDKEDVMSKLTDRDRLAQLEAQERRAAEEVAQARSALRAKYASQVRDHPVERLSEREFRDALVQLVRVGGAAAIAALKPLPAASATPLSR